VDGGGSYRAPYAVVATGVRPQATTEADWISQDGEVSAPPLWKADVSELAGTTSLVLGIDRPLGTLLRTHPDLDMRLLVVYPPAERYKADEVRADPRVVLLPTTQLTLRHDPDGTLHAHTGEEHHTGEAHHTGEEHRFAGNHVYLNLGSRPVVPGGDVRTDESGYCPPGIQDPRILIAGDLRGARYQRIMTAFGSGAEAALTAYYAANELL
jgi:thioredoxin reductase (NADPH)/alkyl hydroperoxide reductase subunit F